MQTSTVLLILLAAIVSLCLVLFQYFFKSRKYKVDKLLGFLRFLALFFSLLLLINPKFSKEEYYVEKPNLIVVSDNSQSISTLKGEKDIKKVLDVIGFNDQLPERFNVSTYSFASKIGTNDTLNFDGKISDIGKAILSLAEIYDKQHSAIILLSDGNQTVGTNYEYLNLNADINVFPVVVGDTTSYEDLRVNQININKYAFLKNRFPIEATIGYSGNRSINSTARIFMNGKQVFQKPLNFTKKKNVVTLNTTIKPNSVGVKDLKVQIDEIENENNVINNVKEFAIEVIDEKTNVAIVSSIAHPDIGALKKSIEANEQRAVQILKPSASNEILEAIDVFILYQPNTSFKRVFDFITSKGVGNFTITGTNTDWDFLNNVQSSYKRESYNQKEDIIPAKNVAFNVFNISDLSFEAYPPLEGKFGDLSILKPYKSIANQKIKGVELNSPLFLIINQEQVKEAVLFGENIWKWRVQAYRNEGDFRTFDDVIGKLMLFLADTEQKSRLTLNYDLIYNRGANAKILASFFDNSYNFNSSANLSLRLTKQESNYNAEFPMLLRASAYEFNLDGLEAGNYNFTVMEKEEKISKSGYFKIINFNLENQFLSSDYKKLRRFARNTGGEAYFPSQIGSLLTDLQKDTRFTPVQKSNRNVVSLIDFRYLLFFMVLALAAEWFIRKYNGLL